MSSEMSLDYNHEDREGNLKLLVHVMLIYTHTHTHRRLRMSLQITQNTVQC